MLWLILGIILLVIAISGGAIIHPIIFVLALVALWMAMIPPARSSQRISLNPAASIIPASRSGSGFTL